MTRKDKLLVTMFLIAILVLASPLLAWFTIRVYHPDDQGLITAIISPLGGEQDAFSGLRLFMAPITVLVATQISKDANSRLVYVGLGFFILVSES